MINHLKQWGLPAWRALIIMALCVIAGELHWQNHQIRKMHQMFEWQQSADWDGVKERLDSIKRETEDLWVLVNELAK